MKPDPSRFGSGPPLSESNEQAAWALLTGEASEDQLDDLLDKAAADPDVAEALEAMADDALTLRSLGDADLRQHLAGSCDGLAAFPDGEADEELDAAIAKLQASRSSWERFVAFATPGKRRRMWGAAVALAAAVLLMVMLPPAPDYEATWRNGAAQNRGTPVQVGSFEVTNVAQLMVRPSSSAAFERPQLKVYVAPEGEPLREAPKFRAQQGTTGAILISLPITKDMPVGTHSVVVLLGTDLTRATPDLPAWWWTRIETRLEVLEDN